MLRDGWYLSGDLGFEADGEYYVIGRKKDIIIAAGKNLHPEDVEDVGQVEGILASPVIPKGGTRPSPTSDAVVGGRPSPRLVPGRGQSSGLDECSPCSRPAWPST